ncbi:MAG: hypothetical protein ABIK95_03080 [Acidobacteriota bacterium]
MKKRLVWMACLAMAGACLPVGAENVSFRITYDLNSIGGGDVNSWLSAANTLWQDWSKNVGGQLTGEFFPIEYGSSYQFEMRIPIYKGFALNLGGTYLTSTSEGTVDFSGDSGQQNESQRLWNQIKAIPVKIGFSLNLRMPFFPKLLVTTGAGRHIVFVRYNTEDRYDASFSTGGQDFNYWYERSNSYKSEALGFYMTAGIELQVFKFLALVGEFEKVWSEVDGFKGEFTYSDFSDTNTNGKASLYYYENAAFGLEGHYPVLAGHENRPVGSTISGVRQGKLNFSGQSLRFGIRFIF